MNITMTWPVLGLIMIFIGIFVASWLAKMNSTMIDAIVYVLGALLFIVAILATIGRMFH